MGLIFMTLLYTTVAVSAPVKKRVIYRDHTSIDFSGEAVRGKIKNPSVFTIFQRKRSQDHQLARPPASFAHRHGSGNESEYLKQLLER